MSKAMWPWHSRTPRSAQRPDKSPLWAVVVAPLAFLVAVVALVAIGTAWAAPDQYAPREAANATRACIPVAGNPTQLSVSASAGSSQLTESTVYSFVCTVAVYWKTGDTSAGTATSSADYLPANTLIYLQTGPGDISRYVVALDTAAASGTCYLHKCR